MLSEQTPSSFSPPENSTVFNVKIQTAENYWVRRSRINIIDFMIYMTDGQKRPAPHHINWAREILDMAVRNLIIEAWPGSAKTTTVVYVIAWMIGLMPWLTHMIVSVSDEQAKQRLSEVREIIESERYHNVFPHIHIDIKRPNSAESLNIWSSVWKDGKEIDYPTYRSYVTRYGEPRDHTVFAAGVTSKSITGKRISGLIAVDDPHNETNSATSAQRTKVTMAIRKEVMSRFSPKSNYTKIVIIMTPWAEDDCAGQFMEDRKSNGKRVWKRIKTPICDENGEPTWKEMFTRDQIADVRAAQGEIVFDLMYMLNETAMAGKQITMDMMRKALPNPLPDFKDMTITTDFSKTEGTKSDYNVFACVGRDREKYFNCYFLAGTRFQDASVHSRSDKLIEFYDEQILAYGENSIKAVIFEKVDSRAEVEEIKEKRPDIPVVLLALHGDKEWRFKPLAGFIQQGRFFYNQLSPILNAMISEHIGFPKATHDDCVDPFSLLFEQPEWMSRYERAGMLIVKSEYAE